MNSRCLVLILLSLLILLPPDVYAQMSPEEAQQLLNKAKSEQINTATDEIRELEPPRLARNYDELNTQSKERLKRFARHCIKTGGDIWSNEANRDRKRQTARLRRMIDAEAYTFVYEDGRTRSGFVDPYEVYGAPVYLCLSDERKKLNIESIQNEIRRQTMKRANSISTPFIIDQVLDNGVRARWGDDDFFIEMNTDGLAEDQKLEAVMQNVGTFEYLTVLGAQRTIKKYRIIDLDFDTEVLPVKASELFDFMIQANLNSFPIYRPEARIEIRPSTDARGGLTRGRYSWEWRLVEQPIDMHAKSDTH